MNLDDINLFLKKNSGFVFTKHRFIGIVFPFLKYQNRDIKPAPMNPQLQVLSVNYQALFMYLR